jgi:hypothetical protein
VIRAPVLAALMLFPTAAQAQRVELPIHEVDLSDGVRRYGVTLQIDGQPVEVGLDTGSVGLRVMPRALAAASDGAKGEHVDYSYGSGTQFEGQVVRVPVAAGPVGGSIKIMRIDHLGCTRAKPDCAAADADPAKFGIQGDGLAGQGFAAILGVRLKRDTVDNTFVELGIKRWIVELPRPGNPAGRLVLNPTDAEIAGYKRLTVDDNGTTGGCIVAAGSFGKICGRSFFDTGASGLRVFSVRRFAPWPNGTAAAIAVGDGSAVASFDVQIGRRDQASGLFYISSSDAKPRLSFGLAPYFRWSVLYDAGKHEIGVKDR